MTAILMIAASSLALSQQQAAPAVTADAPQLMDMSLYCPVRPALDQIGLHLGELPNDGQGGIRSYQIPREIADDASWVQVFAWIFTGNTAPSGQRIYRFTSEWRPYEPIHYYLYAYSYGQQAISYNSDNFWLPVPLSGQVQVSSSGAAFGSNWNSRIRITGYLRKHRGLRCRSD